MLAYSPRAHFALLRLEQLLPRFIVETRPQVFLLSIHGAHTSHTISSQSCQAMATSRMYFQGLRWVQYSTYLRLHQTCCPRSQHFRFQLFTASQDALLKQTLR